MHGVHHDRRAIEQGERLGAGGSGFEAVLPGCVQVEGVHQHQHRLSVDGAGREQLGDLLGRGPIHPAIDLGPGPLGVGHEVGDGQRGPVVAGDRSRNSGFTGSPRWAQIRLARARVTSSPARPQFQVERVHGGVKALGRLRPLQHSRQVLGGAATGPGVQHAQHLVNRVPADRQILVRAVGTQGGHQVQGEGVLGPDQRGEIRPVRVARAIPLPDRAVQHLGRFRAWNRGAGGSALHAAMASSNRHRDRMLGAFVRCFHAVYHLSTSVLASTMLSSIEQ